MHAQIRYMRTCRNVANFSEFFVSFTLTINTGSKYCTFSLCLQGIRKHQTPDLSGAARSGAASW